MLRSRQPLMGLFWDLLAEWWWANPGEVVPVNGVCVCVCVSHIAKQVTLSFSALFGAFNTNLYSLPVKKKKKSFTLVKPLHFLLQIQFKLIYNSFSLTIMCVYVFKVKVIHMAWRRLCMPCTLKDVFKNSSRYIFKDLHRRSFTLTASERAVWFAYYNDVMPYWLECRHKWNFLAMMYFV